MRAWTSPALSDVLRRTAAPAPWFLALNRQAWLAAGGADPRADRLWSASLASRRMSGPGRHLLVGQASAIWLGQQRPRAAKAETTIDALSEEAARAARLIDAGAAVARALNPPTRLQSSAASFSDPFPTTAAQRLLVFADGYGASQYIAFVQGLQQSRSAGRVAVRIVEEAAFGPDGPRFDPDHAAAVLVEQLGQVSPTTVVLSRFGHAGAYRLLQEALADSPAALVAHLDDDLFDLPACVGVERYRTARHPLRIHTLHRGLADADRVLAATRPLAERLRETTKARRVVSLHPGTAGEPHPRRRVSDAHAPLVIGYMGSASHNQDLEMIAPALNAVLGRFDHVSLDLFGSIADQPAADLLRGRVRRLKPVAGDYRAFKKTLAGLGWDIGLAPLRPIPYNLCKTPTKWAEYAEAGVATVASAIGVYAEMISAQAAAPARPDGWEPAIARLITSPALRHELIGASDRLLRERFSWGRLEDTLLRALGRQDATQLAAE